MSDVTFELKDFVNYNNYGFIQVDGNSLLFSVKKLGISGKHKLLIDANFFDVAKCYYHSMKLDKCSSSTRRRKLSNFLKSIYDQDDLDVGLLMIKATAFLIDEGLEEEEIISKIVKEILPNAGYYKSINSEGRYVWNIDNKKKFSRGIGKAFVLTYITNNFDKDLTWAYVKKHCFLKDGVWNYKTDRSRTIIEKTFRSYFNHGGIIVKDVLIQEPKEYKAFIPFGKVYDEEGNLWESLSKEAKEQSHPVIEGIASTTGVDREYERSSKNFIDKMQKTGKGLPILDNTHYASKSADTIGVIIQSGGDEETFKIKARLMKPSDSKGVEFILKQIQTGIVYGFSVGGKVTKVYREFDEKRSKEIYVLDDGELFHVALTTQPANAETLGVAISKSLTLGKEGKTGHNVEDLEYKHSSRLAKAEPEIDDIEVGKLPSVAFPMSIDRKEVYKDYPHHFINEKGVMFLHEGLALKSFTKAVENKAPAAVMNHFTTHLQCIGLGKKIDELVAVAETIDNMGEVKHSVGELEKELKSFFETVKTVGALKTGTEDKMKILSTLIADVSTKIADILKPLTNEESNES